MTILLVIIALLISVSAIYNSYLLRGGKLAFSEVFIALGMVVFIISFVVRLSLPDLVLILGISASDALFVLGFVLLLVASLKLRSSIK